MSTTPYPYNAAQLAWLADLETTTEPQTIGRLHRLEDAPDGKAGWCCLGRACAVLGLPRKTVGDVELFGEEDAFALLAKEAVDALRLRDRRSSHRAESKPSLINLNDNGTSFAEIAAIIRADPDGYFLRPEGDDEKPPLPECRPSLWDIDRG